MTVFFEDGSRLKVRKEVEEHYTSCIADPPLSTWPSSWPACAFPNPACPCYT